MIFATVDDDISSEDKPKKSGYFSAKDAKIVVIVIVVLLPLLLWFYLKGKDSSDQAYCRINIRQIGIALVNYSVANDDRFPPTYNMDSFGEPATVPGTGLPETWATKIHGFMSERNDFWCRIAKPDEGWRSIAGIEGQSTLKGNYGMYRGISTAPKDQIPSPGTTIVISETINHGVSNSSNPSPFENGSDDGFLIGWNDANIEFTSSSKTVSRLAFSNSSAGYEGTTVKGRHGDHINAITIDGNLKVLKGADARVEHSRPRLKGIWWADPNYYK